MPGVLGIKDFESIFTFIWHIIVMKEEIFCNILSSRIGNLHPIFLSHPHPTITDKGRTTADVS